MIPVPGWPVPNKTLQLMRFRQKLLFSFHENREVGLGRTRLPQGLIMKRKIHGMRTASNRWIRYGILIVGVQKDFRAFTPVLQQLRLPSRGKRATNGLRAKKLENRLFFYWTWSPIIATTHSLMRIKATIGIHAKLKYQIRVINVCNKYFEQKCTFLSVFTRMVSSHANLLNHKKVLDKDRVQLPQESFRTAPTWPLFRSNWRPWNHVKTLYKQSSVMSSNSSKSFSL